MQLSFETVDRDCYPHPRSAARRGAQLGRVGVQIGPGTGDGSAALRQLRPGAPHTGPSGIGSATRRASPCPGAVRAVWEPESPAAGD